MTTPLAQAREIISSNKTDQPARDFMTNEQRDALADYYAEKQDFSSAAHFTPDAEKRKEYEELFRKRFNLKA